MTVARLAGYKAFGAPVGNDSFDVRAGARRHAKGPNPGRPSLVWGDAHRSAASVPNVDSRGELWGVLQEASAAAGANSMTWRAS